MNNLKNTDLVLDNYKRSRLIYCIDNMISTSPELEDYIDTTLERGGSTVITLDQCVLPG